MTLGVLWLDLGVLWLDYPIRLQVGLRARLEQLLDHRAVEQ